MQMERASKTTSRLVPNVTGECFSALHYVLAGRRRGPPGPARLGPARGACRGVVRCLLFPR